MTGASLLLGTVELKLNLEDVQRKTVKDPRGSQDMSPHGCSPVTAGSADAQREAAEINNPTATMWTFSLI